jgi:hypothetical protein
MFPESQTKQLFTALIITNLLLVGAFIGVYYLLDNRAATASELTGRIESIRNENQRQQSVGALVENTADARQALDNYFVQPNGSAQFITKIEKIADDTRVDLQIGNVSIESLAQGEPDSDSGNSGSENSTFENLVLELQANGSWERIVHFVRVLELLPERTSIEGVSFEQSGQPGPNESTPLWSVNLTIHVAKLAGS